MSLKKILIYEPYAHKLYGNTRLILFMLNLIDKEKYEPILVIPYQSEFVDMIRNTGSRCVVVPPPSPLRAFGGTMMRNGKIGKFLTGLSIAAHTVALFSLIRRERADIVHCHSIRSLLTIGPAAKLARKPCFLYIKGELNNKILDRIGFFLANKIAFLCEALKNHKYPELINHYKDKIGIVKLGIDLDEIKRIEKNKDTVLKSEIGLSQHYFNIAYLGTVIPQKGLDHLLYALVKVKKQLPDIKLYIVGDHCTEEYLGFKSELDKIISEHDLHNNVVFTGWRKDAIDILNLMDMLVLPTLTEGFGRCIIEAMALGKPVVATRVGGVPDAVRHEETGLLVEPGDSARLADAIITLAKNKDLRSRFGKKARQIAFAEYSIWNTISGIEKCYRELI